MPRHRRLAVVCFDHVFPNGTKQIGELELLDGAVSIPVPIEKSIADGNDFHVIVLTRNKSYTKSAFRHKWILKLLYRKYPKLVEAMLNRHEVYNRQLQLCEELEREGKALIIRPKKPLSLDRLGKNIEKLLMLYDEGHEEGRVAIKRMNELGRI